MRVPSCSSDGSVRGRRRGAAGAPTSALRSAPPALDATDLLMLGFLAFVAALTLGQPFPSLLAGTGLLGATLVFVASWSRIDERARVVHDFFPVLAVIVIFELLGPVIPVVNPTPWDVTFAALDARLFEDLPAAWFSAFGRPSWLTDLASIAYVSYYLLPVVLAIAFYARDRGTFRRFAFVMVATFLCSYAGYLVFPTVGPRTLDDAILGGGSVSRTVRTFVHAAEGNQLDAFPSGHVAMALVSVACGWRHFPRWRIPLAVALGGITFSTVYLSYHYVIDVVAGAGLGATLLVVLPPVARRLIAHDASSHGRNRRPSHAMRSNRPPR